MIKKEVVRVNKVDLRILHILLRASGSLEPFTIFRRSRFGSAVFFEHYFKLLKKNLISEEAGAASLTAIGLDVTKSMLSRVAPAEREWRKAPAHFLGRKLEIEDVYIPNVDLLNRKAFF
ncbi:hypothetical protein [Pseudomonas tohonis]|uniref:hypothetical protein n=1 Tax=Pseudomonas tohonis TaxID=2725477 RepID=UPI0022F0C888|nr:hypothetical protein [Pseudomonas tohonis]